MDDDNLRTIGPVVIILALGITSALISRRARTSPIIGYLVLGGVIKIIGYKIALSTKAIQAVAYLGLVFLLFDIGLHFSLKRIREQAKDIFGFGTAQVVLGTIGLSLIGFIFSLPPLATVMLAAILSLSSTAVVERLIAERHQQNCPVGRTATAILIFQDVAAILLLVIATVLGSGSLLVGGGLALAKVAVAFLVTTILSRYILRPLFDYTARSGAEEVFTALALFIALGAGWAAGAAGLSVTLGAFLGGVAIAETPYRPVVTAEIKPFKGLLLGFFFFSVGLSLDFEVLRAQWPTVVLLTAGLFAIKILTNALASLAFHWSMPGSTQLGFLLSQVSEFAFVILAIPAVRALVGADLSSIVIATVLLSLVLTPAIATAGRKLAGTMRRIKARNNDPELIKRETPPVLIIGMGRRGRALADALNHFGIRYCAVERDHERLNNAVADGYATVFANMADPRLWDPVEARDRKVGVLTSPSLADAQDLAHFASTNHPALKRVAAVKNDADAVRYREMGLLPVTVSEETPGVDLSSQVLALMGVAPAEIEAWSSRQKKQVDVAPGAIMAAA